MQYRYNYNDPSVIAKIHDYYDGWIEQLRNYIRDPENTDELENLKKRFPNSYTETEIVLSFTTFTKYIEPMFRDRYDQEHTQIKNQISKKLYKLIFDYTISGTMENIISYAKENKDQIYFNHTRYRMAFNRFVDPYNIMFNEIFVKDMSKHSNQSWLTYNIPVEQRDQCVKDYFTATQGKVVPGRKSVWMLPEESKLNILVNNKFKLRPTIKSHWDKITSKEDQSDWIYHIMKLYSESTGKQHEQWPTLTDKYLNVKRQLKEEFPHIYDQKNWLSNNLTPKQEKVINRWRQLKKIINSSDLDGSDFLRSLDENELKIISNHLKFIKNDDFLSSSHFSDKILPEITEITSMIRKNKPDLIDWYKSEKRFSISAEKLHNDNKKKILELAKSGAPRPRGKDGLAGSIRLLTNNNTKHKNFKNELTKTRPDWFDQSWDDRNLKNPRPTREQMTQDERNWKKIFVEINNSYKNTFHNDLNYWTGITEELSKKYGYSINVVRAKTKHIKDMWRNNDTHYKKQKLKIYKIIFEEAEENIGNTEWHIRVQSRLNETKITGFRGKFHMILFYRLLNDEWNVLTNNQKLRLDKVRKLVGRNKTSAKKFKANGVVYESKRDAIKEIPKLNQLHKHLPNKYYFIDEGPGKPNKHNFYKCEYGYGTLEYIWTLCKKNNSSYIGSNKNYKVWWRTVSKNHPHKFKKIQKIPTIQDIQNDLITHMSAVKS